MILAVVPANVDFHNSQILRDAKKVDPKSIRTIPVITKPDLVDTGAEKGVLELLRGDEVDFALGFHMVKCPGQQDRNNSITMEEAASKEMSFFRENEPWRTECQNERERFGTLELRKKLAALQVRMIKDNLPSILEEVSVKKRAAEEVLQKIGYSVETDGERRAFYQSAVDSIVKQLDASLAGSTFGAVCSSDDGTFLSKQHALYDEFGKNVLSQKFANVMSIEVGSKVLCTFKDGSEETGKVIRISTDGKRIECKPEFVKDEKTSKFYSKRGVASNGWSFEGVVGNNYALNDDLCCPPKCRRERSSRGQLGQQNRLFFCSRPRRRSPACRLVARRVEEEQGQQPAVLLEPRGFQLDRRQHAERSNRASL